jgi:hypothetical protein
MRDAVEVLRGARWEYEVVRRAVDQAKTAQAVDRVKHVLAACTFVAVAYKLIH